MAIFKKSKGNLIVLDHSLLLGSSEAAEFLFEQGNDARDRGDWKSALEFFRQALKLDPRMAGAFLNIGAIYSNLRKWQRARRQYRNALRVAPGYPLALVHLAGCLEEISQSRYAEAEMCYRKALAIQPNDADALFNLARILALMGRRREAIEQYRRYLPHSVQHPRGWRETAERQIALLQYNDLEVV